MNWRDKLQRFMYGRYGQDQLSRFILIVALVLLVLGSLFRLPLVSTVVMLLLIWTYYRMLSKNVQARYAENQKYLELKDRVLGFFTKTKNRSEDLKTHHIYRCPKCGQKIRVPRGKGMIVITCPKCRTEFKKRS